MLVPAHHPLVQAPKRATDPILRTIHDVGSIIASTWDGSLIGTTFFSVHRTIVQITKGESLMVRRLMQALIYHHQRTATARVVFIATLSLLTLLWSVRPSGATIGTITKADLSGPWAATITGDTGCGITTVYFTFTLNTSGSGSGTAVNHSSGCGDFSSTNTFTISTLNANGSGTGGIGCGTGCGFNLNIQVATRPLSNELRGCKPCKSWELSGGDSHSSMI
jgi:hypothetical protein